jgi:transketolase
LERNDRWVKKRNVVALCADLIGSLKFDDFKKPSERFFQIGLQKQT